MIDVNNAKLDYDDSEQDFPEDDPITFLEKWWIFVKTTKGQGSKYVFSNHKGFP